MKELKHPFDSEEPAAVEPKLMCEYAAKYFRDILTSRRPKEGADTNLALNTDHWEDTKNRLPTHARLDMDRPVTEEEALRALKAMAKGKTSGNDGLPTEFYRKHWDVFGQDLVEIYNEILIGENLPTSACKGIISILYKKGDMNEIRNWRPISLLNVSYKILAKLLARRLGKYLPLLVGDDQAAFVRGLSIFDNIVTAIEVLEVVGKKELDVEADRKEDPDCNQEENDTFSLASVCRGRGRSDVEGRLGVGMQPEGGGGVGAMLARWVLRAICTKGNAHWISLGERILREEWELSRTEDVWACVWVESYLQRRIASEFWAAVLQARKEVKPDMTVQPVTKEEVLSQIIFENQYIRKADGLRFMADTATKSFGRSWISKGVVRVRDLWNTVEGRWYSESEMKTTLKNCKGMGDKCQAIISALPLDWVRLLSPEGVNPPGTWYRVQNSTGETSYLKLLELPVNGGRTFQQWKHQQDSASSLQLEEDSKVRVTVPGGPISEVRVIEKVDERGNWTVELWEGGTPISQLRADPKQWAWRGRGVQGNNLSLGEYTLNVGYEVQGKGQTPLMIAIGRWRQLNVAEEEKVGAALKRCWAQLENAPIPRAAAILWLASLLATTSAVWLLSRGLNIDPQCKRCLWSFESTMHIWWDCPASARIWSWWAEHWETISGGAMKWNREWVLLGGTPEHLQLHRGWGYVAQAFRAIGFWIIWTEQNRTLFQGKVMPDPEIKATFKAMTRRAIMADWKRKVVKGAGYRKGKRWFNETWAANAKLVRIDDRGKVKFGEWLVS
ncbi:hypothetical protein CBR_g40746 [Chara braunii]|uniref:Uncharacterized protein n=1 Tax=Chara braunii TaxID=69332 RepID=A0A388LUL6_CHABU|nr:hypothetical protein CBR_g40746 [Chara braunii]|eukprot:GBG85933.1 hypothetical protein CBR_g40746 [Chara braunii]